MEYTNIDNLPEILAPAGDLETAICAYEAGADAVYLGMSDFSARGGAVNFSLSELRRLRYEADLHEKKIYVTINTVIKENEIKKLVELLCEIELIGVDAVIVQDLGVLKLLNEHFPTLNVHASTQMAVGDLRGLKELEKLGVTRAILPRETTLKEMELLSKDSPIELETFIHGAMCYSHSGNCLASGLLLGRSGNRGKCAQVCRNFFDFYGENIYPFSCNDMCLLKDIVKLKELGISSFKIEGRLKSKEYVSRVVALYRAILDKHSMTKQKVKELLTPVELSYSRKRTKGYFYNSTGEDLINKFYPKNIGEYLGKVKTVVKSKLTLDQPANVKAKDRLIALKPGFNKKSRSLQVLRVERDNDGFVFYGSGIMEGDELYKISSSSLKELKKININDYPEKKFPVTVEVEFIDSKISLFCKVLNRKLSFKREVDVQPSKGVTTISYSLNKQFEKSDKSRFQASISYKGDENLFVPPSVIKKIRKDFYATLDKLFEDIKCKKAGKLSLIADEDVKPIDSKLVEFVSVRRNLNPREERIPFVSLSDLEALDSLATFNSQIFVPLPPFGVTDAFVGRLSEILENHEDKNFVIGLNNISHLGVVSKLSKFKNMSSFLDMYYYVANRYTLKDVPNLLFFYGWVENSAINHPLAITARYKRDLPYMISKGCYHKHILSNGECPKKCKKCYTYNLKENKNSFDVFVNDCVTYLFEK